MFARISVALLALPLFAAASAVARGGGPAPVNQCNTGTVACCNYVGTQQQLLANKDLAADNVLAALVSALVGVTASIGAGCSPISVVGIAGNQCSTQPVCCTNNNFNGLVNVGCSPINLNL